MAERHRKLAELANKMAAVDYVTAVCLLIGLVLAGSVLLYQVVNVICKVMEVLK